MIESSTGLLQIFDQFKVVGQSKPRVDIRAKVTGEAVYGYDMRLPGMLYGAVARPPRTGAKLISAAFDAP